MSIRPFGRHEATVLGAIRLEALADLPMAFAENARSPPEDFSAALAEGAVWGAFEGDVPVAMAGLARYRGGNVRHRATIWGVYVSPRARGLGAGKSLLRAMIHFGAASGIEIFELAAGDFNAPALRLYEGMGFIRCGLRRWAVKIGDDYTDEVEMVLFVDEIRRS